MENTGKVLFPDDSAQWFIALDEKWSGPLPASEVFAKVNQGEIGWTHYVWKEGQANWQRICDCETFKVTLPSPPASKPGAGKPPAPPRAETKEWFVYHQDAQTGPFSTSEVKNSIAGGRLEFDAYAWRDGMGEWDRLSKIATFNQIAPPAKATGAASEKRAAPRKPLVARLMIADDKNVHVAICRDVSIGGMQVLTDAIPGKVGGKIKLNISPPEDKKGSFEPFVAEGTIIRFLEDQRGFSFRFEKLSDSSRAIIEKQISG